MGVVNHPRIELEAVVVQQLTDVVETTGPMPLPAGGSYRSGCAAST
jgi:hypothetical protein